MPAASLDAYSNYEPWKSFQTIVAIQDGDIPVLPKCAKPEISIVDGKVKITCATEGAEFVTKLTVGDTNNYYDSEFALSNKIMISAYATKEGYDNSDVTTTEITFSGDPVKVGDMNQDGKLTITDVINLMDVILTNP